MVERLVRLSLLKIVLFFFTLHSQMASSQESNGLGLDANTLVSNVDKSTRLRTQTELGKQYEFEMAIKHFNQSKIMLSKRLKELECPHSRAVTFKEISLV